MINVEKIVRVLKAETEGLIEGTMAHEMDCGNVGHCALGALLAASGISDRRLENWDVIRLWTPILEYDYGLTPTQSIRLMNHSDAWAVDHESIDNRQTRLDRRDRVVEFVRNMAVAS